MLGPESVSGQGIILFFRKFNIDQKLYKMRPKRTQRRIIITTVLEISMNEGGLKVI